MNLTLEHAIALRSTYLCGQFAASEADVERADRMWKEDIAARKADDQFDVDERGRIKGRIRKETKENERGKRVDIQAPALHIGDEDKFQVGNADGMHLAISATDDWLQVDKARQASGLPCARKPSTWREAMKQVAEEGAVK